MLPTAFLDGLLASAVGHSVGVRSVTAHLSVDFLAMGRAGEWVIGQARRSTRQAAAWISPSPRVTPGLAT